MAAKIQLTPEELIAQSQEMLSLCKEFEALFQKNESVLKIVNQNWSTNLAHNFAGKIGSAQKANAGIINMLTKGAQLAETSAKTFENIDKVLEKKFFVSDLEERDGRWGTASKNHYIYKSDDGEDFWYFGKAGTSNTSSLKSSGKSTIKKRDRIDSNDPFYYEVNYKDEVDENYTKFYDVKAKILEQKWEAKAEASLLGGTYTDGGCTVSGSVLSAEAHASFAGGLYVVGADGEKMFSPGINAEVGASVSVLKASWDQQWLGDENLGINTHVETTVGKAEAKATANLQLFDEKGIPKVQVYGKASAEAIAAELKGSAGVNILGGEVGVSGSVNFGIGAHAEIGFKDGVIKCDVGASLGLGASVAFEVDVGEMVDTVVDNIDEIADTAGEVIDAASDFMDDAVDAVSDTAKAAWDGVVDFFSW